MSRRLPCAIALVLAVAPITVGCVSMGANYDPAAVASLQPGMTRADVEKILGKPTSVVTSGDGTSEISWLHSQGSMMSAKARMVVLQFDANGRFVRMVSSAESNIR